MFAQGRVQRDKYRADKTPSKIESDLEGNNTLSFHDKPSRVPSKRHTLKELDHHTPPAPQTMSVSAVGYSEDLVHFARQGGPDLCHLRGYRRWTDKAGMMPLRSLASSYKEPVESSEATSSTSQIEVYTKNILLTNLLIDNNIFPALYRRPGCQIQKPVNIGEIYKRIVPPTASLSSSEVSETAFDDFLLENEGSGTKRDLTTRIFPLIFGNTKITGNLNLPITELEPITTCQTQLRPDFLDGAIHDDLDRALREDESIRSTVIPTAQRTLPVACNFFVEVGRKDGDASVMETQACHAGAYGARAMHSLQNWRKEEQVFDGKARTFSATYHAGTRTLQLYSHHITAPKTAEDMPEYHMTKLRGFDLTDCPRTFMKGVTAFRNLGELARECRDNIIKETNARARGEIPSVEQRIPTSTAENGGSLSPIEVVDDQRFHHSHDAADDIISLSSRLDLDQNSTATDKNTALTACVIEEDQQDTNQDVLSTGASNQQESLETSLTSPSASDVITGGPGTRSKRKGELDSTPKYSQKRQRRRSD